MVHYGVAEGVHDQRPTVRAAAYAAHAGRFVRGVPQPTPLPTAVWINLPLRHTDRQDSPGSTVVTPGDQRIPWTSSPLMTTEAVQ